MDEAKAAALLAAIKASADQLTAAADRLQQLLASTTGLQTALDALALTLEKMRESNLEMIDDLADKLEDAGLIVVSDSGERGSDGADDEEA